MAIDRIYGDFQTAGVRVTTAAKSQVNNDGTNGYASLVGALGADGLTLATSANPVPTSAGAPSSAAFPATGATTSVAAAVTATPILASDAARRGATVTNDSASILYLLLGAGTVSSSVYTVEMAGNAGGRPDYYEVPFGFTGAITGIWVSATGSARVTTFSA